MIKIITIKTFKEAFNNIEKELLSQKEYLNELDSSIGDSDHGQSVVKAFKGANEAINIKEEIDNIGELLLEVAKSIISSAGGATGPLYGSCFMAASKEIGSKEKLDLTGFKQFLEAMEKGLINRGGAEPGDKTMLDTLHPAVEEVKKADTLEEALSKALTAAEEGKESTKEMISGRGRSKRLGDRSKGHIDPGAASMFIIINEFIKSFQKKL